MKLAVARRNEGLNAISDNANNGKLRFYSGTRPTDADTALSGNTLLAELTLASVAFSPAANGTLTANTIGNANVLATGTVTFARVFEADGVTAFCDLSVGGPNQPAPPALPFEVLVNATNFVTGAPLAIAGFSITWSVGS